VTFEAEAGTGATLTITDIPDWLGTDTAIPAAKCETG
jgi:hypothetical protein